MTITEQAEAATTAVLSQQAAPSTNCCAVGEAGFATSEAAMFQAYAEAMAELSNAEVFLAEQAEINRAGWATTESQIQALSTNNPNYGTLVMNMVIAESLVTEVAFNSAEARLFAEYVAAEAVLTGAESVMAAESALLTKTCSPGAETDTETNTTETSLIEGVGTAHAGKLSAAGISDLDALSKVVTAATRIEGVSPERLEHWKNMAKLLIDYPALDGNDVELLSHGLGLDDREQVEAAKGKISAEQLAAAKQKAKLPAKFDDSRVRALLGI
jgi:hypothetical protein